MRAAGGADGGALRWHLQGQGCVLPCLAAVGMRLAAARGFDRVTPACMRVGGGLLGGRDGCFVEVLCAAWVGFGPAGLLAVCAGTCSFAFAPVKPQPARAAAGHPAPCKCAMRAYAMMMTFREGRRPRDAGYSSLLEALTSICFNAHELTMQRSAQPQPGKQQASHATGQLQQEKSMCRQAPRVRSMCRQAGSSRPLQAGGGHDPRTPAGDDERRQRPGRCGATSSAGARGQPGVAGTLPQPAERALLHPHVLRVL